MLLGYTYDDFGYWLWDLVKKMVFLSKYVIFIEDQTVKDLQKESSSDVSVEGDNMHL